MRLVFALLLALWVLPAHAHDLTIARPAERPELPPTATLKIADVVWLSDSDPRFGGLSGLLVSPDGKNMLAMSDDGVLVYATIDYAADGTIARIGNVRYEELTDQHGKPLTSYWRNSEGLTLYNGCAGNPQASAQHPFACVAISFENVMRIYAYDLTTPATGRMAQVLPVPPKKSPNSNQGLEALRQLHDGTMVTGFECMRRDSYHVGFMGQGNLQQPLYLPAVGRYCLTDIAQQNNGDLLLLERDVGMMGGWGMAIVQVPFAPLANGVLPHYRVLMQTHGYFGYPDNAEGLAVAQNRLFVVSDDNFKAFQRTVLIVLDVKN